MVHAKVFKTSSIVLGTGSDVSTSMTEDLRIFKTKKLNMLAYLSCMNSVCQFIQKVTQLRHQAWLGQKRKKCRQSSQNNSVENPHWCKMERNASSQCSHCILSCYSYKIGNLCRQTFKSLNNVFKINFENLIITAMIRFRSDSPIQH